MPKPASLLDLSGCLCADGRCEGCNALAEAWTAMTEALKSIAEWREFPSVNGRDGKPSTYATEYGSNGERDFMRREAQGALTLADKVSRGR